MIRKILIGLVAALALITLAVVLILQSAWFSNYLKQKIIVATEESTGGRVEIGAFHFYPWHLTAVIDDFTLHGTEPAGTAPLAYVKRLEVRLNLASSFEISYLGLTAPHVNLIVNADNSTNIPAPKIKSTSKTSPLQSVIDLAIAEFHIEQGELDYAQRSQQFSAQGTNFRALINFNPFNHSYAGRVLIDPLLLNLNGIDPLRVRVNLPLLIESNAISVSGAELATDRSQLQINVGLRNLKSPHIAGRVLASVSLADLKLGTAKQIINAEMQASYDDATQQVQIQSAHAVYGKSILDAAGTLSQQIESLTFTSKIDLAQFTNQVSGLLNLRGKASLSAVDGTFSTRVRNVDLSGPFHADKELIRADANVFNAGPYATVSGTVNAQDYFKRKGTTGLLAKANLNVSSGYAGMSVSGKLSGQFNGATQVIRLDDSYLTWPHSRLDASGTINQQINFSFNSQDLSDFRSLTTAIQLDSGTAQLNGQVTGSVAAPYLNAHASIAAFAVQSAFDIAASSKNATLTNGTISTKEGNGVFNAAIDLKNFQPAPSSNVFANLTVLHAAVTQYGVEAKITGEAHLRGTYSDPIASANANVDAAGGHLQATASLEKNLTKFHANATGVQLAQIRPDLFGVLSLVADGGGPVNDPNSTFSATVNSDLGAVNATGNYVSGKLQAHLATDQLNLAKLKQVENLTGFASLQADVSGTVKDNNFSTHAKVVFKQVHYQMASLEGEATVDGPLTNLEALTGRIQLNQLQIEQNQFKLQNVGTAVVLLDHSALKVQNLNLQGNKTNLQVGGALSLTDDKNPLGLTLKGDADLSLLHDYNRNFYSSGALLLDAAVHGSLAKPLLNGRVELKNANVNYTDASNGISNGNGVLLLNGSSASIQNFTGETGGGKVSITGFVGFAPNDIIFTLQAHATKVRTRYLGVSVTGNADIGLSGNTTRSALTGTVSVQRIAYSAAADAGSILSQTAAAPQVAASAPSPLLSGMRLDVRVVTAPDLRVVSPYTQKVSLNSNLSIRGTAQDPGVIGRINVTNGEVLFFGNTYSVNSGSVNFYNANSIQPILDVSLQTTTQGVDVSLGVKGPVSDLKLSYRSDPPLTFEQIVQLLATNTTPADPTIAAHQPTPPPQSTSQMGESALLGQAIANPLASRVQRVFGLSQFKIDPSISGSGGQPSARVTLQERIANNLTFTYITDVTQTNSQIVKAQFDVTPKISAVALRDYNGNVSIEFFYKFQVR